MNQFRGTYAFKTTPYKHQRRAVKFMLRHDGGALLMEPRTGKTKTTIDWLSILHQQRMCDRVIIVCPNRVMGTWVQEIFIHSPARVNVVVWDAKARKKGPPPEPLPGVLNFLIVNYEAFATPGRYTPCKVVVKGKVCPGTRGVCTHSRRRSKASGRFKTRKLLLQWKGTRPGALILDESHKIKSPSGKAANMLVTMRPAFKYRAILTGTVITKASRAHDVYMQWQFLNPETFKDLPTLAEFKARYADWIEASTSDGSSYKKFKGPRNMAELHRRIRQDGFIVRRDECFDLPPREHVVEFVDLSGSARIYKQMAEEMVAKIDEGVYAEASLAIVQALRLSQITSGFVTDEMGEVRRLGFEKAKVLEEILENAFDQEQKIVVAARWKPDLDLIEALGRKYKVPVFTIRGKVKRAVSDQAIVDFRELDGAGLMVLQPAAASLGIDLSTAAHMVWYSHTPSWVDFTQCCDRIALSRNSTTFTHLVARGTVDEVLLNTLATDGDVGRGIMSHPEELINGHPLDLDDHSRLRGIGSFQFNPKEGTRK